MKSPLFLVPALILVATPQVIAQSVCLSKLDQEINRISSQGLVSSARLGIFAQSFNQSSKATQILVNRDGDRAFIPASNQKIITSAIALHYLGADYRVPTSLMTETAPQNGELSGNLWVVGRGDPTLTSQKGLKALVTQLKQRGVLTIRGDIKFLSALQGSSLSKGWEFQDLHEYYAAPASAFTLDENSHYWTVTPTKRGQPPRFSWDFPELVQGWRVENRAITSSRNGSYTLYNDRPYGQKVLRFGGTIPENEEPELGGVVIPDQQAYFRERLLAELAQQGIQISLTPVDNLGKAQIELAQFLSPPLAEILPNINKESNNLHAEQLLRILGTKLQQIESNSYLAGIKQIQKFFQEQSLPRTGLVIADGSGLSRYNLVTPKMLVAVLQVMANNSSFRNSLAIAGVDGTLKKRFRNTIAVNNIRAKTGTITGAVALSGYAQNPDFQEITFSIMINNTSQSTTESRRVIDAIALLLVRLKKC